MYLVQWKAVEEIQSADQHPWAEAPACGQLTIIAAGIIHTLRPVASFQVVAAQAQMLHAVAVFVPAVDAVPAA